METYKLVDRIIKSDENDKMEKLAILLGINHPNNVE